MKKVAVTVAVLAFGLAACEPRTDTTVEDEANVTNVADEDVNVAADDATADNALDAAGNALEAAGNEIENAVEAVENAAENATR